MTHARRFVIHPDGQAPMTALGVSLAIEAMLGLETGKKLASGLYLPHAVVDPAQAVEALRDIGAVIDDRWNLAASATAEAAAELSI